ncbi:MAG: TetR/AcrR family transcriptional regulator [Kurthia gibsonii]|uniref:TetR/AcrR family transcriptional regulator n=1 Tax=Kurthia gibsonii TaxID=33946 RepID=A0ABU9LNR3_9BACL|nr:MULTISPECIES: TetR/AcrR family transcriptional regulator [Kurthia]MCA9725077.1 TetR/AcrR family transcriptional regulator [Kurthia sp.]AMA64562.1 bacterial regulatory s, tetR family protein [Kurthia sp. 11kri321]MEB6113512.1 TetR/AcrR family transcriptional regulator [Kurthia gibsonii]RXH51589.1 TetR/AcrR family transcriptional regulator [Kurthia gibsonii]HZG10996.1 TetR/AcrR family transcriptional regulator [Kurthia gibsonii]
MNKKEIQMSRMWKYFVDATADIIQEEGLEHVTIRKVADRAGYNSATIYNYFSEMSHLIFFASMKFLKDYTEEVAQYIQKGKDPIEQYLLAWECFCRHSFKQPQIFHAVFIMDLTDPPEKLLEDYYKIYPADLINIPEELQSILFERNVSKRGRSFLEIALKEGYIKEENVDAINELTILVWQGMFTNILNNRKSYDAQTAVDITMNYITEIVQNANLFHFKEPKQEE